MWKLKKRNEVIKIIPPIIVIISVFASFGTIPKLNVITNNFIQTFYWIGFIIII
jgi:hypothetical protein